MESEISKEYIIKKLKHYARTKEIQCYYDQVQWQIGKTYRIRVGHIYDLSKFWIVHLEKELSVFQDYLNVLYTSHSESYRINIEDITKKMYCMVYSDGNYCRGIIVDLPNLGTLQTCVVAFLVDFGFIVTIPTDHVYYLLRELYQIPRFAVRACLNKILPIDGDTWTLDVVKRFNELVSSKVLLCIVEILVPISKTLLITIGEVDQNSRVQDIRDLLLSEKLAKSLNIKRIRKGCKKRKQFMPNTSLPCLLPTFQALEEGKMPSNVLVSEMLKGFKGSAALLKPYYVLNFDNIDNSIEKPEIKKLSSDSNKSKIDCTALIRSHSGNSFS